jgi:phospholipid-binding lipoprotein MlaA
MDRSTLLSLSFVLFTSGCATSGNAQDPLEPYNRAMFTFNDKADQFVMKPVATAYHTVTPSFVQTGVGNFFGNLGDVWTGINDILQGKFSYGGSDFLRFGVNTTFGIAGLFDIGTAIGIQKRNRDFGETLGTWGVKSGPYVVLPLLGSSTLRDTVALPVDYSGSPWDYVYPIHLRNEGTILQFVDQRARLLDASNLLDEAALDRYEFVRDAYLQRREGKVRDDGSVPNKQNETPKAPAATPGKDDGSNSSAPASNNPPAQN